MKTRIIKTLRNIGIVLAVGIAYYIFIKLTGWAIPCPFRKMFGFYCPGCGVSRMLISIIQMDFVSAFHYNPALFCLSPLLAICYAAEKIKYIKYGERPFYRWQNFILIGALVILFAFSIYRNVTEGFHYDSVLGEIINFIQ